MTDADDRVARYILDTYREDHPQHHLATCEQAEVIHPDAEDGAYGCDTGCEYVRFTATIRCPHEEHRDYAYGEFGSLADILESMDRELTPPAPLVPDQSLTDSARIQGPFTLGHGQVQWTCQIGGLGGPAVNVVVQEGVQLQARAFSNAQGTTALQLVDPDGVVVATSAMVSPVGG